MEPEKHIVHVRPKEHTDASKQLFTNSSPKTKVVLVPNRTDKQYLSLYKSGYSLREIAKLCDVSAPTVMRHLKKFADYQAQVSERKYNRAAFDIEKARQLRRQGHTYQSISNVLRTPVSTIFDNLHSKAGD